MEFTYEGLVRCGFGFFNPNHAAAFICAVVPFVWILILSAKVWKKCLAWTLSAALLVALAFTYSRAGLVVLLAEAAIFWGIRRDWKIPLAIFAALFAAFAFSGALGRISYDAAMSNRWDIWLAGLELFSANPLGVGLGNSGKIAGAFLLPEGIECRTMVNSHLTFFCEFGFIGALILFAAIAHAFLNGVAARGRSAVRLAAFASFCGLLLSGAFSTIFDLEPMLRPSAYAHMTPLNIAMQWVLSLTFAAIAAFLLSWRVSGKRLFFSFLLSFLMSVLCLAIGSFGKDAPSVEFLNGKAFVGISKTPYRLALFGGEYDLKAAAKLLEKLGLLDDCRIYADSWQLESALPEIEANEYILMGCACEFSNILPEGASAVLVFPNRFFEPPSGKVKRIYLPKWDSGYDSLRERCKELDIKFDDI